jgi:hypothetical protein
MGFGPEPLQALSPPARALYPAPSAPGPGRERQLLTSFVALSLALCAEKERIFSNFRMEAF